MPRQARARFGCRDLWCRVSDVLADFCVFFDSHDSEEIPFRVYRLPVGSFTKSTCQKTCQDQGC